MEKLLEGVVIDTSGETAKVRISVHSDCENCGVCPGTNAMILDVVDEIGAETGQRVLVENKETNMLRAAFTVYMLPLLAIGLGVGLGYYLSAWLKVSANLGMILGGIVFAVPALYIVKRLDRSMQSEKPIIVRTIK